MCQEASMVLENKTAQSEGSIISGIPVQEWDGEMKPVATSTTWYREAFWQEHVDRFRASGTSVAEYCSAYDLKTFQLHYWQRKLS